MSQLHYFQYTSLLVFWEMQQKMSQVFGTLSPTWEIQLQFPAWAWPGSALATAAIWESNQRMEDLLSRSFHPLIFK